VEVVEFLRTEKFRERSPLGGTLSRLTRVVDLLHVKEPQTPEGDHWAKLSVFPVQAEPPIPPADDGARSICALGRIKGTSSLYHCSLVDGAGKRYI
jgi:hypothetical protein